MKAIKVIILETNEVFTSIECVAEKLGVTPQSAYLALINGTKIKGVTICRYEERGCSWNSKFKKEWTSACNLLLKSKKDLSKIPLVCSNPTSDNCI